MSEPCTRVYVHFVWATRDRMPLIEQSHETELYAVIRAKGREIGCNVLAVGGVSDHVHVLAELGSVTTLSMFAKEMKGTSSHFMNHGFHLADKFRWQGSYGAFSVCRKEVSSVARYIGRQKAHHAEGRLSDDLERCEEIES